MNPTPAEMENGSPRSHSANTPPVAASGTFRKINSASFDEPNVACSRTKIITRATGTATASRALASCKFLNVPPHASE